MDKQQVVDWLNTHPLTPIHIDCVTTVMLKILDGKCKMRPEEKQVIALLYDETKALSGQVLADGLHDLIASARQVLDDDVKNQLYEQRLLAETTISRPVMKGFKALIRQQGLLADVVENEA